MMPGKRGRPRKADRLASDLTWLTTLAEEEAELGRRRLRWFARMAWPYAGTDGPLVDGWYVDAICDHLQAAAEGKIKRLVLNMPPRMGKSTFAAVCLPAWCWVRDSGKRMSFSSYSDTFAQRDSMATRDLVQSQWYRDRWVRGAWELLADRNTQRMFGNTKGGRRMVLGKATGEGGTLVLVDDPISADDAHSKAERDASIRWWAQTMSTRANRIAETSFVIVMQRLHEDDLSGHVLASEAGYEHLMIPMEYDPKRSVVTSLGVPDPRTQEGELLCPERYSCEELDKLKVAMGSYAYAGQMNQNPAPAEGGIFQKSFWRFWKPDGVVDAALPRPDKCWSGPAIPLPAKFDEEVISLDASFRGADHNDNCAFVVIGAKGAQRFVLEVVARPMTFTQCKAVMRDLCARYPRARRRLVEGKANGDAVVDDLKSEVPGLIIVDPEGGKESRAHAALPAVEAGDVHLRDGAPWLDEWVQEFGVFPKGSKDDRVDAFTQAINYLQDSRVAMMKKAYGIK